MAKPWIVSFRRSGYNYLANLLWRNLENSWADYEELHYSHSRVCPEPYVCVTRDLLPTMLSWYRIKGRFGVGECSFSEFIRTAVADLPVATACDVHYNGRRVTESHRTQDSVLTLPELWSASTSLFLLQAKLSLHYNSLVRDPLRCVQAVSEVFSCPMRGAFDPVLERVGWWPAKEEQPSVVRSDLELLQSVQDQFDSTPRRQECVRL